MLQRSYYSSSFSDLSTCQSPVTQNIGIFSSDIPELSDRKRQALVLFLHLWISGALTFTQPPLVTHLVHNLMDFLHSPMDFGRRIRRMFQATETA